MRIGHEATETIRCNFDPVQGLILGEGVQVDQEHVFEDGEGALINPYQVPPPPSVPFTLTRHGLVLNTAYEFQ